MLYKILKYPLLLGTLVLSFLLLAACATAWVHPSTTMFFVYLGLAFPVIALFNLLAGIYWVLKRKWYLIIPLGSMFLCSHNIQKTLGIHRNNASEKVIVDKIKVLSYNIKLFDFYDKDTKVLDYLLKQDADIVCLQEFGYYTGSEKRFLTRAHIMDKMKEKYPYHHFSQSDLQLKGTYGMATFSKHPVVKHDDIAIESRYKSAIYSDIKIGDDTLRVINLHLESNKLTSAERELLQHIRNTDSTNSKAKAINKKLSEAYSLREKQADKVSELIEQTRHPIVLCGDINDVPVSYTYSTLAGSKLTDSFTERGKGYGHTFNEGMIKFRIDDIMHSKELCAKKYVRDKVPYSDHYPVIVDLAWTKQ